MTRIVDLTEKKILVTGASSGIGRETAILLSELGARVVLIARKEDALQETLAQMQGSGHYVIPVDLSDLELIKTVVSDAVAYDGNKLDGLVHCAGKTKIVSLRLLNYESMDEVMRVNFYSFIELCKHFSSRKNSDGGSIVTISSTASLKPNKGQIAYGSSKAALNAAVSGLSKELASKDIRVNAILPGFVRTKMSEDFFLKAGDNVDIKQLLGIGEPRDIANMAAFLLSDAAKFITGSLFNVDGGKL